MLFLLLSLACAPEAERLGEAQAYRRALAPEVPLTEALSLCAGLAEEDARGDCATAALEARGRLERADCAAMPDGRWRDECKFLLAERLGAAGSVREAVALCQETRFSRECCFHLLRSQARATLDPADAAARLADFEAAWAAPDAALLFWQEWFRARQMEGQPVSMAACERAQAGDGCVRAVKQSWEDAMRAMTPERLCAALASGEPPLTLRGGAPAYILDEGLTAAAARRCGAAREAR